MSQSSDSDAASSEIQTLELEPITLIWSPWWPWATLMRDARSPGGVAIPHTPGVYEVRSRARPLDERLTIGRASSLRFRLKELVKPSGFHSTGWRLRPNEDVARVVIRWAQTDRPACAEEALHQRYRVRFGQLPTYVKHT